MSSLFCLFIKNKINKTQKHCRRVSLSLMISFIFPLFKPFLLLFACFFDAKHPLFLLRPTPYCYTAKNRTAVILLLSSPRSDSSSSAFPYAYPHHFLYILNKNKIFSRQPSKFIRLFFGKIDNKISIFTQIPHSASPRFFLPVLFLILKLQEHVIK